MHRQDVLLELKPLLEKHLDTGGYVLVDARFYRDSMGQNVLELLVDRAEGGIKLDECVRLNRELGDIIEKSALVGQNYILDISSPGMDRPLVSRADFKRNIGYKVRVFLKEAYQGKIEYCAQIAGVGEGELVLNTGEKTLKIPLGIINKAKQVII